MKLTPAQIACLKACQDTQNPWHGLNRRAFGARSSCLAKLARLGLVYRPTLAEGIITQAGITALLENESPS